MISLICQILKNKTKKNEETKYKQSFRCKEQTGVCQKGWEWGGRKIEEVD